MAAPIPRLREHRRRRAEIRPAAADRCHARGAGNETANTRTTPLSKPQTFGRYEVQRVLGRGGMGTVYLAVDPLIDRTVAIKEIRVDQIEDVKERTELEARFRLEYRSAGTLSHQNIVTIYDVVEDNGSYYIAMEYVDGMSLAERLKKQPTPPPHELCHLAEQIASGLDYAHRRGIVHRDIKPANVLLTPDGRPKITDFGLAKWRTSELTMTGTILGTPAFMSPEQVMGQEVDGKSDQFSFSIILYLMLTGNQPFHADHPSAILYKIVHEQPPPPREVNRVLPPAVDRTMLRALAKKPEDRFPSCSDLAAELRVALSDEQTTPLPQRTAAVPEAVATRLQAATPSRLQAPTPTRSQVATPATGLTAAETPATANEVTLAAATPTPIRQRRRRGSGAARWLVGAVFVAAIGGLAYWASSLRQQAAPEPPAEIGSTPQPRPAEPLIEQVLSVEAGPPGAVIRVNGEDTALRVPAELPLSGKPGEAVTVELLVDGQVVDRRKLELGPEAPEPWRAEPALPVALRITSLPEGATIRVGGQDTGLRTPAEVEFEPGVKHTLTLTLAGHHPKRWTFLPEELTDEQRQGLYFPLTASAPPGFITIKKASYPVWLEIDGRRHGPLEPGGEVPVAPGRHKVVLLAEDVFLRQTKTIEVDSGDRESLRAPKAVAVRITAIPANCEVAVDGVDLGATPIINRRMVVGSHDFKFYWPAEDVKKIIRKTVSREGQRISETLK